MQDRGFTVMEGSDTDPAGGGVPRVSVVIPAYNRGATLPAAIDSVLDQGGPACEVIVVDDGSRDATAEVLAGYGSRIRVVRKANGGLASARNAGMRVARGEFVAWLDSDDVWLPGKLAEQMRVLEGRPEVMLVCSDFAAFNDQGVFDSSHISSYYSAVQRCGRDFLALYGGRLPDVEQAGGPRVYGGRVYETLALGNFVHPPTVIFRRQALALVGEEDETLDDCADYDFFLRVARVGSLAYVDSPLLGYRYGANQMSADTHLARQRAALIRLLDKLVRRDPHLPRRQPQVFRCRIGEALIAAAHEHAETQPGAALRYLARAARLGYLPPRTLRVFARMLLPRAVLEARRRRLAGARS
ncbi:MAG TPA: glycosyltransferase [Gammaproteobacteria bacterium]|nr:glycosyltransferase [Gammaproteobacteria bacterium]